MSNNEKKQRPAAYDNDLIKQCKDFLSVEIPASNILFVDEFSKFMPLFNKELFEETPAEVREQLVNEYNSRFSMRHPIKILTRVQDENGVFYPDHHAKFKVDQTIPPTFRNVATLNDLGKKVPALINALYNATVHSSGPYDTRKQQYTRAIAEAIVVANDKVGHADKDRKDFNAAASKLVSKQKTQETQKAATTDTDCSTGMFDW